MATQRKFSDLDFNFNIHPATGDVIRLYDDASIKQSVKSLIFTNFYDRPFQPALGSGLLGSLFENDNDLSKYAFSNAIYEIIRNHEPRVKLEIDDIFVSYDDSELAYKVDIQLEVVGQEKDIKTSITLDRIR